MDFTRRTLLLTDSSLRPPRSPSPQVPDVTEADTGLEWFEKTASAGPTSSDHGVPSSPLVFAQSSPLCDFAVPSTPVQHTMQFPLSLKEESCGPARNSTISPLVQIVPTFGEEEPFRRRKYSFKSRHHPSLEMTRRKLETKDKN